MHFLSNARVANELVRASGVGSGDLVVEFGAGFGAITEPLADTGATVLAVERDEHFVRRLRRRFQCRDTVRIRHADARLFPLPRRNFTVVASIPFAVSSPLLRRMLDPARRPLCGADIIVEWGLAKRVTTRIPRDLEMAWWNARYRIRVHRRVPASAFTPAPSVDAAHLTIRRVPGMTGATHKALWLLLASAYRQPGLRAGSLLKTVLGGRPPHRSLEAAGITPHTPVREVAPRQWAELARDLATVRPGRWPELPKKLAEDR
ncbi:MAG: methyltransferase domain-containing protein [Pseudonocardiaceae bacterium]|nr:methyltransferase domain-containing protein [Pseudonocardiaceae bacterium]